MTGGSRVEWDGLRQEVAAAMSRCLACNGNKFASGHSGLTCEACGVIKGVNKAKGNDMSGGQEEAAFTFGKIVFAEKQDNVSALNEQIDGNHYIKQGDYQPWKVLKAWLTPEEFRGYMKGTAIAYLSREADKGGDQDIKKAAHTLEGLIALGLWK